MTLNSTVDSHDLAKQIDVLNALLMQALEAGQKYRKHFSSLSALARSLESSSTTSEDRATLLTLLQSVAISAEFEVGLDVELLRGLLNGHQVGQTLRQETDQAEEVIVATGRMLH